MSEKEKKMAETIKKALPKMTDFDKGYFLAKAEAAMERREEKEAEEDER